MLLIPLPHQNLVSSPLEREIGFLGSEGDGYIFKGNAHGEKLEKLKLEYKKLKFAEATIVLEALESFLNLQPARLTFGTRRYILGQDGVVENWNNDFVDITIKLQEA
jgi:hypothetical protein